MESSDKDGLLGVQPLTGTSDVVTVSQHPGDDLNLLAPHPPARDLEVPGGVAMRALGEKERNMFLVIKHDVDVTLRGRGGTVLARPLNPDDERNVREIRFPYNSPDLTKLGESLHQTDLCDVPGNSAQENLG